MESTQGAKAAAGVANEYSFSLALACPDHDYSLDELDPRDFSFNAPYGACPDCLGLGFRQGVDPDLVVPDKSLSVAEGAIALWSPSSNYYPQMYAAVCKDVGASVDTPWEELSAKAKKALLYGLGDKRIRIDYVTRDGRDTYWFTRWPGVLAEIMRKHDESDSDRTRERLEEYMAITPCDTCHGSRLKPEILAVTVGGKNIHEATELSAADALEFFGSLEFGETQAIIGNPIIKEICTRLQFMVDVGLDYLTLERPTATLSGGEAQRIRLATQIGAGLMGVLYILDEPSIGLHQRDNERLIETLQHLRDIGNTVIVVEHDEETIRCADYVVDIGPGAGVAGGEVVAVGTPDDIAACERSITGQYLCGKRSVPIPAERRKPKRGKITLSGAKREQPQKRQGRHRDRHAHRGHGRERVRARARLSPTRLLPPWQTRSCTRTSASASTASSPAWRPSTRSSTSTSPPSAARRARTPPPTSGVWDDIRKLFASLAGKPSATRLRPRALLLQRRRRTLRGLQGRRPAQDRDALPARRLRAVRGVPRRPLQPRDAPGDLPGQERLRGPEHDRQRGRGLFRERSPTSSASCRRSTTSGLGYITPRAALRRRFPAARRSASSSQASCRSARRARRSTSSTSPRRAFTSKTCASCSRCCSALVDAGNTVLVIEHNLDVIKAADRIIDLGPEGGDKGGTIVATGTPEQVAQVPESWTGRFLKDLLTR